MAEFGRSEDERRKRLDASLLYRMARQFTRLAITWIQANAVFERHIDPILREAFEIVCWDSSLLTIKLRRALDSRDQFERHEEYDDDDPIQNDWNGSAQVALISVQRSAEAWSALGLRLATPQPHRSAKPLKVFEMLSSISSLTPCGSDGPDLMTSAHHAQNGRRKRMGDPSHGRHPRSHRETET
jgi:hypothetical protein